MTNKQISDILSDMVIIWDSREQKNKHILDYLDTNKIPYECEKLKSGDYTFILPNYPELNIDRKFLVERKANLSELAGNFTTGRDRFQREFERLDDDEKIHLVLESSSWKKLYNGTYRSKLNPRSFVASLLTWSIRYNIPVWMVETGESPELIYRILYYELYEFLKSQK